MSDKPIETKALHIYKKDLVDKNKWVINKIFVKVVKQIFALDKKGYEISNIAK